MKKEPTIEKVTIKYKNDELAREQLIELIAKIIFDNEIFRGDEINEN